MREDLNTPASGEVPRVGVRTHQEESQKENTPRTELVYIWIRDVQFVKE